MASGEKKEQMMELSSLLWFRKGLRVHDNPALLHAALRSRRLLPVFVLDPGYLRPDPSAPSPGSARAGTSRIRFLLESLSDLDVSLRRLGSRLLVLRGGSCDPAEVVMGALRDWRIGMVCFEFDSEPYYQDLDRRVKEYASSNGIEVFSPVSHTLFDPAEVIRKNGGRAPLTYQSFLKVAGQPSPPVELEISSLPQVGDIGEYGNLDVPTMGELGYNDTEIDFSPFHGGETEALRRLKDFLANKKKVASFEKPKGDPSAFIEPSTTILSPYLKFGCLSSRYFYQCIMDVCNDVGKYTNPPVSLAGQLLWREFFYTVAYGTPNFDRMKGNGICKQIPWKEDEKLLAAWRDGRTGFPWIDAIMIQLRKWGWMHHLARHSVACFLTRGDLFIHWEKGRDVFERLLIDSDWAINNGNWMWLSCSSFFYQYNRIYSPISFGKKYDPNGNFIRHFIPVLRDMPREYIYEPWTAPKSVQREVHCIIGRDYPKPVVSHEAASKECKQRMGEAYRMGKAGSNGVASEDDAKRSSGKLENPEARAKRRKLGKIGKHL